ncbi:uncharacterized protein LOC132736278 isoform X1 [Ruditapes philippinarum]|uniref:uncharacterized protein LOC132736278 isoform X1 n=1 Tax=Ruditapes philippinarum TaxID=129788 RepID=UPI00295B749B|nr:uncharacterized protein LOC132736278 isoform X1 [Ruditapes philippinarum]
MTSKSRGQMCCVYACSNCRYDKENNLTGVHFFNIPKRVIEEKKYRDRWCNLIKRQDGRDGFKLTPRTVICHEHFKENDIKIALNSKRWCLKPDVEQSVFDWSKICTRKPPKERFPLSPLKSLEEEETYIATPLPNYNMFKSDAEEESEFYIGTADKACQTDPFEIIPHETSCIGTSVDELDHSYSTPIKGVSELEMLQKQINNLIKKCDQLQCVISDLNNVITDFEANRFSLDKICDDKHAVMFYTGFPNIETFNAFYEYIKTKSERLNYWR